jgi:hypothetical protein
VAGHVLARHALHIHQLQDGLGHRLAHAQVVDRVEEPARGWGSGREGPGAGPGARPEGRLRRAAALGAAGCPRRRRQHASDAPVLQEAQRRGKHPPRVQLGRPDQALLPAALPAAGAAVVLNIQLPAHVAVGGAACSRRQHPQRSGRGKRVGGGSRRPQRCHASDASTSQRAPQCARACAAPAPVRAGCSWASPAVVPVPSDAWLAAPRGGSWCPLRLLPNAGAVGSAS